MLAKWTESDWLVLIMSFYCVVGIGGYLLIHIWTDPDNQEKREDKRRRKYRDQIED